MVLAIPYFGDNNNIIINNILSSKEKYSKKESLYNIITPSFEQMIVVIIDNKWLAWLSDIECNYRDRKCRLAYWKFDTMPLDKNLVKNNNHQYIIEDDDNNYYIRYNFDYNYIDICNGTKLLLYNVSTNEKYSVTVDNYINDNIFSIEKLYNLYINNCYKDDKLLNNNIKGYYYINKYSKQLTNIEYMLRVRLNINTFKDFNSLNFDDYRDVRNYTIEQINQKVGLVDSIDNYKIRRLKFESYLYCILRQHLVSDDEQFNKKFNKLGKSISILKYGNGIKLIFKDYWLDEHKPIKIKSWMKAQV